MNEKLKLILLPALPVIFCVAIYQAWKLIKEIRSKKDE